MNRYTDKQIELLLRKPVVTVRMRRTAVLASLFIFIFYYAFFFCRLFVSVSPRVVGVL